MTFNDLRTSEPNTLFLELEEVLAISRTAGLRIVRGGSRYQPHCQN